MATSASDSPRATCAGTSCKLPEVSLTGCVGTIDPGRSVAARRAYVGAFFDLHLRGKPTQL